MIKFRGHFPLRVATNSIYYCLFWGRGEYEAKFKLDELYS